MRVISGKNKGLKLQPPKNDIRPTLDRVKEAVFNVIQFKVSGSSVLDMFAGSGAYGIEAHSRGAQSVIFNDNSNYACSLIRENCRKANFEPIIIKSEYIEAINRLAAQNARFDIIFLDPPYQFNGEKAVMEILKYNLLADNGVIVYEYRNTHTLKEDLNFKINTKKYGKVYIDFIYKY